MPILPSYETTRAARFAAGMSAFDEVDEDAEAASLVSGRDLIDIDS
jgi:hypothetical protein